MTIGYCIRNYYYYFVSVKLFIRTCLRRAREECMRHTVSKQMLRMECVIVCIVSHLNTECV